MKIDESSRNRHPSETRLPSGATRHPPKRPEKSKPGILSYMQNTNTPSSHHRKHNTHASIHHDQPYVIVPRSSKASSATTPKSAQTPSSHSAALGPERAGPFPITRPRVPVAAARPRARVCIHRSFVKRSPHCCPWPRAVWERHPGRRRVVATS